MNPDLVGVWEHMRELGLAALSHANRHAAYYDPENPRWAEMSVLQAAHAAEILIKARIAQEHPLLIFEHLPKTSGNTNMTFEELYEKGKSIDWQDLPNRLWATTGISLPNIEIYKKFGTLRNGIQHFSFPSASINLTETTLRFVFSVIDPFINSCWGLFAIDYDEDYDSCEHFPPAIINYQIEFLVSKNVAEYSSDWDIDWTKIDESYKNLIQDRIKKALK